MREIKFRGLTEKGKWVCGYYTQWFFGEEKRAAIIEGDATACITPVIPESVGQFMWQKDKNGIDIYEGDILKGNRINDDFTGALQRRGIPLYWDEIKVAQFEVTDRMVSFSLPKSKTYSERHPENEIKWEIIGNTTQNPELINQQ